MPGAFEQSADFSFKLYVAHNENFFMLYIFIYLKDQQNAILKTKYNRLQTRFISNATSYMFRHQGAIISEYRM
jgi:hypothetical protein